MAHPAEMDPFEIVARYNAGIEKAAKREARAAARALARDRALVDEVRGYLESGRTEVFARPDGQALYRHAVAAGKRLFEAEGGRA